MTSDVQVKTGCSVWSWVRKKGIGCLQQGTWTCIVNCKDEDWCNTGSLFFLTFIVCDFLLLFRDAWSVGVVECVNTIKKKRKGSVNRYLDKIMTLYKYYFYVIRFRVPESTKDNSCINIHFSPLQNFQIGSVVHPARLLVEGYRGSYPGVKWLRCVDHSPPISC